MLTCIFGQLMNGALGIKNDLPWQGEKFKMLRSFDMNFFKEITIGKDIVMGSKTWESLDYKPLPKRGKHFILTNRTVITDFSNQVVWLSLNDFKNYHKTNLEKEFVVIGGAQIYNQLLLDCDIVYQTIYYPYSGEIYTEVESDPSTVYINKELLSVLQDTEKYTRKRIGECQYNDDALTISKYTKIKH